MFNALRDDVFGPFHVGPAGKRRVRKGGARRKTASPSRKLKTGGGVVKKTNATRASKKILKRTYKVNTSYLCILCII